MTSTPAVTFAATLALALCLVGGMGCAAPAAVALQAPSDMAPAAAHEERGPALPTATEAPTLPAANEGTADEVRLSEGALLAAPRVETVGVVRGPRRGAAVDEPERCSRGRGRGRRSAVLGVTW